MDITGKMLMDLAGEAGLKKKRGISEEDMKAAQKKAEEYKGKNDEELIKEIAAMKDALKKDRKAYEQQMKTIKALRPVMTEEQKARLDKIIKLLES